MCMVNINGKIENYDGKHCFYCKCKYILKNRNKKIIRFKF